MKELSVFYAKLINQNKFKYHTLFSARFYKINEEDQRSNEIDLYINLNNNNNLTESDIDNIDNKSQLEHQIQVLETMETGGIFDRIISLKISFYKTGQLNDSSYVKIPLRSSAILNIQNNDTYCFVWSIWLVFILVKTIILTEFQIIINILIKINIDGFDFTNGFNCSDVHNFIAINNLSVNIYELNFYQDKNNII